MFLKVLFSVKLNGYIYILGAVAKALLKKGGDKLRREAASKCKTYHFSRGVRRPVFRVSDQVPHEPGCTTTEDGYRILKEEGLYYLCSKNKDTDQLCSNRTADLHLCFGICIHVISPDLRGFSRF